MLIRNLAGVSGDTGIQLQPVNEHAERRAWERRVAHDRRAEVRFEPGKFNRRSGQGRRRLEVLGFC